MATAENLSIPGWMHESELDWLSGKAESMNSVAEIGSWKGRSTFALLSACKGPVYAIDHWLGSKEERQTQHREIAEGVDVFAQFMNHVGQFPNLYVVKSDSITASTLVPDVDMVFIDGGHDFEQVVADIRAWLPKARKLICGHDAWYDTVVRAVWQELGHLHLEQGPVSIWFAPTD